MSESAIPTQTPAQGVQVPVTPPIVPVVQPAQSEALSNPAPTLPTAPAAVVTDAPTVQSLQAELKAMKAQMEHRDLESAVMERINPEKAKYAKAILAGLSLGNGGVKARTASAIKAFETDFPELLRAAQEAPAAGATQTPAEATKPAPAQPTAKFPAAPAPASSTPTGVQPLTNKRGVRLF